MNNQSRTLNSIRYLCSDGYRTIPERKEQLPQPYELDTVCVSRIYPNGEKYELYLAFPLVDVPMDSILEMLHYMYLFKECELEYGTQFLGQFKKGDYRYRPNKYCYESDAHDFALDLESLRYTCGVNHLSLEKKLIEKSRV